MKERKFKHEFGEADFVVAPLVKASGGDEADELKRESNYAVHVFYENR